MILFVSGRCDIPAFYSRWFYQRLKEGVVDVRNPFNPHQISRIYLNEQNIDAILFCTKNPIPMMDRLDEIAFPYLFHITITPYHTDIEAGIHSKKDIIEAVKKLSLKLGKDRVIIRYDPILLSPHYTVEYHQRAFEKMCVELSGYVNRIVISFVDMYKNTRQNMARMKLKEMDEEDMKQVAAVLGEIGLRYHMQIQTCAEGVDLEKYHIKKGLCVDPRELEKLIGYPLEPKGKGIRETCSCYPTVDIGDYNCCAHGCLYCYANYDSGKIQERMKLHDPYSSILLGHIGPEDKVTIREEKRVRQMPLLWD